MRIEKIVECQICKKMIPFRNMTQHINSKKCINSLVKKEKNVCRNSSWNKGLTKQNDQRVKKNALAVSNAYKSGKKRPWQLGLTKQSDQRIKKVSQKISITVNEKINRNQWHVSFAKRKTYRYKNQTFHGTWQLKYAIFLDSKNINWIRNKKKFPYVFLDKKRTYTPDFYLPDEDCYVQIKGYQTQKDRSKWSQFTKRLKILHGRDLKQLNIIQNYRIIKK